MSEDASQNSNRLAQAPLDTGRTWCFFVFLHYYSNYQRILSDNIQYFWFFQIPTHPHMFSSLVSYCPPNVSVRSEKDGPPHSLQNRCKQRAPLKSLFWATSLNSADSFQLEISCSPPPFATFIEGGLGKLGFFILNFEFCIDLRSCGKINWMNLKSLILWFDDQNLFVN